jgi:glycosyltransferase involved in cell wall biosynthesis
VKIILQDFSIYLLGWVKMNRNMRVCMVAYTFYESDSRVIMYAEALAQKGAHVDILSLQHQNKIPYEIINDVHIHRIQKRAIKEKSKFSYFFKILLFLIRASKWLVFHQPKEKYDLIHVHSVPDFLVFSGFYQKIKGAKIILDIHDILPEFYLSKFSKDNNSFLFKPLVFIEKISCSYADHVIAANHLWQDKLSKRSVLSEKCSTFLNYPMNNIFQAKPSVKLNGGFVIAYPGSLNKHQGLDVAIRAIHKVKEKIPNIELRIIGEGSEKKNLIQLSKDLQLEDEINFQDRVPIEDIPIILQDVDLGIVPKQNTQFGGEAFSTKIFEFMALGIPVVVSDTRIDKYYFDESLVKFFQAGNADDLADALIYLYENENIRKSLICKGYQYIKDNSWDVKRSEYYKLIDNLLLN